MPWPMPTLRVNAMLCASAVGSKYSRPGAWKTDCAAGENGFPVKTRLRTSHGESTRPGDAPESAMRASLGRHARHGAASQSRTSTATGTTPAG